MTDAATVSNLIYPGLGYLSRRVKAYIEVYKLITSAYCSSFSSRSLLILPAIQFLLLLADFKYTMQCNKSPTSMEILKVTVPKHRYYAFRKLWTDIFTPVFYQMKIIPHLHAKTRKVELQTKADTPVNNLKKCAHFLHAFLLGFDLGDANPLLFNDDLCIESSEIKKVKPVRRGHASRGLLARLSDKGGKTKSAVEISTNTRILISGSKLHIIGLSTNIRAARIFICRVILGGSPAVKANSEGRPRIARLRDLICLACSYLWLCPEKLIKL